MNFFNRHSDVSKELAERRKLLREYKSLKEFVEKSKLITEKYSKKVDKTIS